MDGGSGIGFETPLPPLPRRPRPAALPPPPRVVVVERGRRRVAADFAGGTGGGALSPDLGREEATIGFVTGGDALSPDQTGGGGEDVEGGGSPAQIVVGRSCEMGSSQAVAGIVGLGLGIMWERER